MLPSLISGPPATRPLPHHPGACRRREPDRSPPARPPSSLARDRIVLDSHSSCLQSVPSHGASIPHTLAKAARLSGLLKARRSATPRSVTTISTSCPGVVIGPCRRSTKVGLPEDRVVMATMLSPLLKIPAPPA